MPIFNKWLRTERRTDADPQAWQRNKGGNLLMRHFGAAPEGVNVYLFFDSYSDIYSDLYEQNISEDDPVDYSACRLILLGGHDTEIDDALAAELTAAGYGEWITADPSSDSFTDSFEASF